MRKPGVVTAPLIVNENTTHGTQLIQHDLAGIRRWFRREDVLANGLLVGGNRGTVTGNGRRFGDDELPLLQYLRVRWQRQPRTLLRILTLACLSVSSIGLASVGAKDGLPSHESRCARPRDRRDPSFDRLCHTSVGRQSHFFCPRLAKPDAGEQIGTPRSRCAAKFRGWRAIEREILQQRQLIVAEAPAVALSLCPLFPPHQRTRGQGRPRRAGTTDGCRRGRAGLL